MSILSKKKINDLPLSTVRFHLPECHAVEGYPMPEEHTDLLDTLIETFELVYTEHGELFTVINGVLASDPCTTYTVYIQDHTSEVAKLDTIIVKYAKLLGQTEILCTLGDGTTNLYPVG